MKNRARESMENMSPKGERMTASTRSSRARRLGVADDALHGREGAAQRALDLVDVLVHLDHAHRRRGAAVEVDDFAGLGVAYPHIVDVMDRGRGGKARQRG